MKTITVCCPRDHFDVMHTLVPIFSMMMKVNPIIPMDLKSIEYMGATEDRIALFAKEMHLDKIYKADGVLVMLKSMQRTKSVMEELKYAVSMDKTVYIMPIGELLYDNDLPAQIESCFKTAFGKTVTSLNRISFDNCKGDGYEFTIYQVYYQ